VNGYGGFATDGVLSSADDGHQRAKRGETFGCGHSVFEVVGDDSFARFDSAVPTIGALVALHHRWRRFIHGTFAGVEHLVRQRSCLVLKVRLISLETK
jgi:hypothetical protein